MQTIFILNSINNIEKNIFSQKKSVRYFNWEWRKNVCANENWKKSLKIHVSLTWARNEFPSSINFDSNY